MNVALSFPGCHRRGGVERIVWECARHLAGRGHAVSVFAEEWESIPGASIDWRLVPRHRLLPDFARGFGYFRACTGALRTADFDVLNTHGCVCPTGGVQWVQSIQRAWLETSRRFRPPWSWPRLRQRLNPLHPVLLALEERHFRERRYRRVIATTPEIRADLGRLYDVPENDVEVIPNGFSPTEFNPERRESLREEMRQSLGLAPDHVALIFVANELQRKGYGTLLRAVRIAAAPELRVLVLGRADPAEIARQAHAEGVGGQVIDCGSTNDLGRFHAAADAFVLPTQYEAFCLAILEALGSGLPVVTTRVPGAQNAIVPGGNGELVDADQPEELAAVLRTLCDPARRGVLAGGAAESVREYQWPSVLARYEQVLMAATA